ncbi:MAG: YhbY family RNA-binding protein [Burkholderiales bacterium]
MEPLAPARRRALRAKAHHLHPVVSIGQHGLTPAVLHELDVNLLAHELIKVRVFSDQRDERDTLLKRICDALGATPVQHIGKLLVVWRPAPEKRASKAPRPAAPPRATASQRAREPAAGEPRGKRRPAARPTHKTMAKSTPQARRPRTPTARTSPRPPATGARAPASAARPPGVRARRRRGTG